MKAAVEWVDDLLACRDGEGTDATRLESIAASIQRDALAAARDDACFSCARGFAFDESGAYHTGEGIRTHECNASMIVRRLHALAPKEPE